MTHLIMTFYIFFSFPSGLRQHCCFKNARLFLGLPAKNQINPKVLMLLLSLCRLVNVVGVGCTPALSEAGRLKLLSCRAAAATAASVASATASKTWGWRRSSSSRRGAPNFDPQNFDPQIIETEFWSSDYWDRILILRLLRLTKMLGSATASKMWGWQRSSSSRRGAPNFDPQII